MVFKKSALVVSFLVASAIAYAEEPEFLYREIHGSETYEPAGHLAFSHDGSMLVSGGSSLRVWDMDSRQVVFSMTESNGVDLPYIDHVAFVPGDSLIVVSATEGNQYISGIFRSDTGEFVNAYSLSPLVYSPDGSKIAGVTEWGTMYAWSREAWDEVALEDTLWSFDEDGHTDDDVTSLVFSPDGSILASGGEDARVFLLNSTTGEVIHSLDMHENTGRRSRIRSILFSSDGSTLITSGDEFIYEWDVATGDLEHRISKRGASGLSLSNDDKILIYKVTDISIRNRDTRKYMATLGTPLIASNIALSPDNRILARSGVGFIDQGDSVVAVAYVELWDMSPYIDIPEVPTFVQTVGETPTEFTLGQNYPNPFNAETTIKFELPYLGKVPLGIYNSTGALVRRVYVRGKGEYVWNGTNNRGHQVASGVYVYKLGHQRNKMTLLR